MPSPFPISIISCINIVTGKAGKQFHSWFVNTDDGGCTCYQCPMEELPEMVLNFLHAHATNLHSRLIFDSSGAEKFVAVVTEK